MFSAAIVVIGQSSSKCLGLSSRTTIVPSTLFPNFTILFMSRHHQCQCPMAIHIQYVRSLGEYFQVFLRASFYMIPKLSHRFSFVSPSLYMSKKDQQEHHKCKQRDLVRWLWLINPIWEQKGLSHSGH